MFTDQLPNAQTASAHFNDVNERLKNEFILYGTANPDGIKLLAPVKVTSLLRRGVEDLASADKAHAVHLTKKIIYSKASPLRRAHVKRRVYDTLYEVAIVNQNGIYETLTWTTTPAHLRAGLRAGVFSAHTFQNPLTRMIAQLGQYKRKVFERSTEEDFVVKHNAKKLEIVDFAQNCIELLQSLYSSINNFDISKSPAANLQIIFDKLDKARENTAHLRGDLRDTHEFYKNISTYKNQLEVRLNNNTNKVLTHAEVQKILKTFSNPLANPDLSLQNFLQNQLNAIMLMAVRANYEVSGLFQDSSGLHKIISDAQVTAESFSSDNIDYHNPSSPAHAFDFNDKTSADDRVTIDLSNYGFEPSNVAELAKQVALMGCVDCETELFDKDDKVRGFFGINWHGNKVAPLYWLLNGAKDILGTVLDVGYLIVKGVNDIGLYLRGKPSSPAHFPSGLPILLKTDLTETKYAALPINKLIYQKDDPTIIPHHSFLEKIYSGIVAVFSRLLIEPLVSISNIVADEFWRFKTIRKILYDSTIGTKPADENAVGMLLQHRINEMNGNVACNSVTQFSMLENYRFLPDRTPVSSYQKLAEDFASLKQKSPAAANIPYALTPDNPGDFTTWLADDFMRGLVEVFSKGMYRDHPIAGLALSIAAATAAPMIIPALGNNVVLGAINQNISVPIAQFLIGDTTGLLAGVSTGLLQGQMAFFAADLFNGRNSLPVNGAKILFENPVIASVVTLAAVGFGYTIAYKMQIPWLSSLIVAETDQATFPYFELALAGAKIAAIMVEGTLNLHGSHHHGDTNQMVNDAVEKLRPEITAAIQKGYLTELNLDVNALNREHFLVIDSRVEQYCTQIKNEIPKPHLTGQLQVLTEVVARAIQENQDDSTKVIQHNFIKYLERQEIRHKILQLNPDILTARDKYLILNYLTQTYPHDTDYLASVRNHFDQEPKAGPLSETVKIILAYPGMMIRSMLAGIRYLRFQIESYNFRRYKQIEDAAEARQKAHHALQPVRDLGRKIKNDTGLLIKSVASLLRTTWGLLGSIAMVPVMVVLFIPLKILSAVFSPISWFSQSAAFMQYNRLVFAPGRVSQMINTIVGTMRSDASAKNLALATFDMDIRYTRNLLNPDASKRPTGSAVNLKSVSPQEIPMNVLHLSLEKTVLNILITEFQQRTSLMPFVEPNPATLEDIINTISRELAKGQQSEHLYSLLKSKSTFNKDLKAALNAAINKIKTLDNVDFAQSFAYQQKLVDLLNMNRREPLVLFDKAYQSFRECELPAGTIPIQLDIIHRELTKAQTALKQLSTAYDATKSRTQIVIDILEAYPCLSLQSVQSIILMKKIIASFKKEAKAEKAMAEKLLHALELIHTGARSTAYLLADYPGIEESLVNNKHYTNSLAPKSHSPAALLKLLGVIQPKDFPVPQPDPTMDETIQDSISLQA